MVGNTGRGTGPKRACSAPRAPPVRGPMSRAASPDRARLTLFLNELARGDPRAAESLMPVVYRELKAVARAQVRQQSPGATLQPTALVHEAFLRLFDTNQSGWNDRRHFFAFAAKTMRRILVDDARRKQRLKRGGGRLTIGLTSEPEAASGPPVDLVDLDLALEELGHRDEQQMRIVELRFFGGLEVQDVADLLAVSKSTIEREWRCARAWLGVRLEQGHGV